MTLPYGLNDAAFSRETVKGPVTVRPLRLGDRSEWQRLWGLYIIFYEAVLPEAQYELSWARLFDPAEPMFGFIAEIDGKAHGLVHIVFHRSFWLDGPSCYLQDLYADDSVRGTGVGHALIEHVYAVAREAGSERVHWLTAHTNNTARKLYDRVANLTGFVQYAKAV